MKRTCQPSGDGFCLQCGCPLPERMLRRCEGAPCGDIRGVRKHRGGVGDSVERMLRSIGITEDRYKRVKELFGLPPVCNCAERKAWLNKVDNWFRSLLGDGSA